MAWGLAFLAFIAGILFGWLLEWWLVTFQLKGELFIFQQDSKDRFKTDKAQNLPEEDLPSKTKEGIAQLKQRIAELEAECERCKIAALSVEQTLGTSADHLRDDLTLLAGVGPRTAELMQKAKIDSFAKIAAMDVDILLKLLQTHNIPYNKAKVMSWPSQASCAAQGDWQGLREK
ncbi:MAG: hypothetical protein CR991_09500 [Proteobacteria bacterium]|nr:MAG: hypothetical protein CR991_09500 [Pseudomonadota bacterium]